MDIKSLLNETITLKDLLNYYNATVKYKEMPIKIHGFVFLYKGLFIIIINKYLSYYKRKKAILHELAHIELNQLEQLDNDLFAFKTSEYEDEADKYIKFILEDIK